MKITIIVRGICCLIPGVKGQSENIRIVSIVDRFLEHPRVYLFYNGGDERMYVSSADWMTRNMNRRIEVGFPVKDQRVFSFIKRILDIQLADNVKTRLINKKQTNPYVKVREGADHVQAQLAIHSFIRDWEQTENNVLPGESN